MARNLEITLPLEPVVIEYIDRLIEVGLWGEDRTEVALSLLRRGLQEAWFAIETPAQSKDTQDD